MAPERDLSQYTPHLLPFGEVRPGDLLNSPTGPTEVLRVHEEHVPRSMYRLEFDGGQVIEASGNHLWYIETSLDRSLHRRRIKDGKKLLKNMDAEVEETLLQMAEDEEVTEAKLTQMMQLLGVKGGDKAMVQLLVRVASSIGHIVDEKITFQDMGTGDEAEGEFIRLYDGNLFAQQILSLKSRAHRRRWPLIVGSVVTTEHLARLALDVEIPEISQELPRASA